MSFIMFSFDQVFEDVELAVTAERCNRILDVSSSSAPYIFNARVCCSYCLPVSRSVCSFYNLYAISICLFFFKKKSPLNLLED